MKLKKLVKKAIKEVKLFTAEDRFYFKKWLSLKKEKKAAKEQTRKDTHARSNQAPGSGGMSMI